MPGRVWYVMALLVLVAGAVAAGVFVYIRLDGLAHQLVQVIVPGEADLTFHEPGTYTIYFEPESVVNGQIYRTTGDIAGLVVKLSSASGDPINLVPPSISSNYSIAGRYGEAVLTGTIEEPGQYRLSAAYVDASNQSEAVLAIGLGVPAKIFTAILVALGIAICSFLLAVLVAIVTFVRRRRATRRASAPQPRPVPS
ncbi:MAG TPA: hypothetical protein VH702_10995 [Vicinamibacterales bacterium]|jgi:hypothetical protein